MRAERGPLAQAREAPERQLEAARARVGVVVQEQRDVEGRAREVVDAPEARVHERARGARPGRELAVAARLEGREVRGLAVREHRVEEPQAPELARARRRQELADRRGEERRRLVREEAAAHVVAQADAARGEHEVPQLERVGAAVRLAAPSLGLAHVDAVARPADAHGRLRRRRRGQRGDEDEQLVAQHAWLALHN